MIGKNRVVITGIGVLAANGIGKESFWNSLLTGQSGIGPITLFDASDLPITAVGEVKGFKAADFIKPQLKPKRMGRFTQLALAAANEAIKDSKLDEAYLSTLPQVPVIVGSSATAMDLLAEKATTTTAVMSIPNAASSIIAHAYNLSALIQTPSNGCASSLDAVATGYDLIARGKSDVVITGGADSTITKYVLECFLKARKLPDLSNRDLSACCKPFDLFRSGGVVAEGAGIIILESEHHALAREADIYCSILGYGSAMDPVYRPEGTGLPSAMRSALANASVCKNDVEYINAHAPGDQHMDFIEVEAIKSVFKENAFDIPITSIKGACGSAMGTGGVHQLIATALSLKARILPHTTNYSAEDPDLELDIIKSENRSLRPRITMVNTHGFGRSNGSMILQAD